MFAGRAGTIPRVARAPRRLLSFAPMRWVRYAAIPAAMAFAAFFAVLPTTGADATIRIVGSGPESWRFEPAVLHVGKGARIAFHNDTHATHTATCGTCVTNAWDTGDIQPGQTVFLTFDHEGGSRFFCRYHQSIVPGTLQVGPEGSPSPSSS
jgi:plastocyanin